MSEKIMETQEKLKELGYFASTELAKIVLLFNEAGKKSKKSIPTLLLEGPSGAGKTFLGESFAKLINAEEVFVQCFPRMGNENFQYDVDIEGVIKQDAENSIKNGVLLQAIEKSKKGPVVLVIDELDKARPEVDAFLLDFLENGRLTTGTDTYKKGEYPIYTFITSNKKREIDDALINRSKRVIIPRPERETFLEILGLPQDHYLKYIYDKCPEFSIRQARQYLEDLDVLGVEFDTDALSQYIDLDNSDLDVHSLAELKELSQLDSSSLEFNIPTLQRFAVPIYEQSGEIWSQIIKDGHKSEFTFFTRGDGQYDDTLYAGIDTLQQLKLIQQYYGRDFAYEGWFEYDLPGEEFNQENIIWAANKNDQYGTRFGIEVDGENFFKIAINHGNTFVYLDTGKDLTLERFSGQKEENGHELD